MDGRGVAAFVALPVVLCGVVRKVLVPWVALPQSAGCRLDACMWDGPAWYLPLPSFAPPSRT